MNGEPSTERAEDVVKNLKKKVEAQCGPIFISKLKLRELADLYSAYKREYGQRFAAEEIQLRIESEL
ncbi:MAG TPA: hypothetical protein VEG65_08220 [Candidatus Bathyarchaeia archaeon]|nr:hypothetical protein [Candidatus Bathyarchaeia archaeon]